MSTVQFCNVTHVINRAGKRTDILRNVTLEVPVATLALVGESRMATGAVIDLLCRKAVPKHGHLLFAGTLSWPIGHPGPFSIAVTGTQALSHFATLYGIDRALYIDFMKAEFAAPWLLNTPMAKWPKDLVEQFNALAVLVPGFDLYIVDGNLVWPNDSAFTRQFLNLFNRRREGKTTLITVRQARALHTLCSGALVIADQTLTVQADLAEALKISNRINLAPVTDTADRDDTDDAMFL